MSASLHHPLRTATTALGPTGGRVPRSTGAAMSGRDWQAFDAELRARVPELVGELLGKPTFRAGQEWRWGRKGSLSVVIAGPGAGMWFDHEAGEGGGLVDLVGRVRGLNRREALDWTADRIGMADEFARPRPAGRATRPSAHCGRTPPARSR